MKKITNLIFLICCTIQANSQSVSSYLFAESTENYLPVTGTVSTAAGDDGTQNSIPIGFGFNFGGLDYTTFSISTNGWIRLGGAITGNSYSNILSNSNTQNPLIAPFWDDHNRTTGSIQYAFSGTSPSQILEIGWDNINISNGGNTSSTGFGSFKMRIHETSGEIEFIYGSAISSAGVISASIGLNDGNSFLSLNPAATSTVSSTVAYNNINSSTFITGKKYTFNPQPICNGIPTPGNTISSTTSACPSVDFILTLQNSTSGFGLGYQWASSTDGISYVPIGNGTSQSLIVNQTVAHFYQCMVTCGDTNATSTPVEVLMTNGSNCYCVPTYTTGKTLGDLISNVEITGTTLSNNTGTAPVNPSYTYFNGQPNYTAVLQSGASYTMNITVGTFANQNIAVWIDSNNDGIFGSDEMIGYSQPIGANGTGTFTITLGCADSGGTRRMRVRDVWSTTGASIDPCLNYGYGETEEYDVTVISTSSCQLPFGLGTVVNNPTSAELIWGTSCGQTSWDVHVALEGGGLPVGAPSHPNVTSTLIVAGLQPSTGYEFYVKAHCGSNGESDWAGPFVFYTAHPGVGDDDCETATSLIVGGTFEEHAVIGTNIGATKTIGQPNPTCAVFNFGGDVWFSTTVPPDGNITVEVQADPGSLFNDSGMTVFTGTCGSLTAVGCSDDEGIGAFSKLSLTGLIPGETIYARVWEYANDTFGSFQISAYNPALKNTEFEGSDFVYYPNPVKDMLEISAPHTISQIGVYNILGQQVLLQKVDASRAKINMSSLSQGTYIVRITSDKKLSNLKVIKE